MAHFYLSPIFWCGLLKACPAQGSQGSAFSSVTVTGENGFEPLIANLAGFLFLLRLIKWGESRLTIVAGSLSSVERGSIFDHRDSLVPTIEVATAEGTREHDPAKQTGGSNDSEKARNKVSSYLRIHRLFRPLFIPVSDPFELKPGKQPVRSTNEPLAQNRITASLAISISSSIGIPIVSDRLSRAKR